MFYFQLMGGLGNQMFQYAAAKSLSLKRDIPFKVDFNDPYIQVKRKYNLDVFRVDPSFASNKELKLCKPKIKFEKRLWLLMGRNPSNKLFKEKQDFCFDEDFFRCPDNSYISGFWQSEKYFIDISDQIRKDFEFINLPSMENKKVLDQILNSESVSIHIRRGDYVSVEKTNMLHGLCGIEYYHKAIELISNIEKNPVFFVFSDDIPWAKENLKIPYQTCFTDINLEGCAHEDLRLMSKCKHNIIANSSFSWWGAWLNQNKDKNVIVPSNWMKNVLTIETDLIPESWIII